jgi:hypothetical protein
VRIEVHLVEASTIILAWAVEINVSFEVDVSFKRQRKETSSKDKEEWSVY